MGRQYRYVVVIEPAQKKHSRLLCHKELTLSLGQFKKTEHVGLKSSEPSSSEEKQRRILVVFRSFAGITGHEAMAVGAWSLSWDPALQDRKLFPWHGKLMCILPICRAWRWSCCLVTPCRAQSCKQAWYVLHMLAFEDGMFAWPVKRYPSTLQLAAHAHYNSLYFFEDKHLMYKSPKKVLGSKKLGRLVHQPQN
eukprot:1161094-Pelagomonas_calceolata.AAC.1